jgi:hypothetical protein
VSVWETVLIYVVPPVVVYLVLAGLTLGRRNAKRARYRTGESWEYAPVLWTANPEGAHLTAHHGEAETQQELAHTATTGGARGHW